MMGVYMASYAQNTFPTTGNVGIGTTAPYGKLQVINTEEDSNGKALVIGQVTSATSSNLRLGYNSTYTWIQSHGQKPLYINELGNNLILNKTTGNVGIGTTNPTEKLAVNGVIRAKEIKVESGWADYVFDESYELKSLGEVEAFIKNNRHLPGLPSERKVKEEGVELGEMNRLLLEKVEELTLHLIEEQKARLTMEKEVSDLKKEIGSMKAIKEVMNQ
ncbi:hypothetical protein QT327_21700 [Olivibacter sp. 47]|uniref:hypothetical protein n=1 Tax=Olivibacter sp. 47 TaxID=3056486 RepID=UPI0025A42739|nr:hypothetical protein [Olivibacter sp. 47]MDM8176931.1 hypothetical protein [Olivibacter sp. 47]